jgi:hypothetical protein
MVATPAYPKKAVRGHSFRDGASFSNSCQLRFHLSRDGWHLEALIYGQPRESASPPSGVCPMRAVQPDGRRRANSKNRQVIDTTPHFRATGKAGSGRVDRFKLQAFVMPQASRTRCMLASGTDLGVRS